MRDRLKGPAAMLAAVILLGAATGEASALDPRPHPEPGPRVTAAHKPHPHKKNHVPGGTVLEGVIRDQSRGTLTPKGRKKLHTFLHRGHRVVALAHRL